MRMKMRPRYYCDHCNRGNGSPSAMKRHEKHCTANPHRICRMCGTQAPDVAKHAALLLQPDKTWKQKMGDLREEVEECPCCILAAIRQSNVQKNWAENITGEEYISDNYDDIQWDGMMLGFDFKKESKEYLNERNNRKYDYYCHGIM